MGPGTASGGRKGNMYLSENYAAHRSKQDCKLRLMTGKNHRKERASSKLDSETMHRNTIY